MLHKYKKATYILTIRHCTQLPLIFSTFIKELWRLSPSFRVLSWKILRRNWDGDRFCLWDHMTIMHFWSLPTSCHSYIPPNMLSHHLEIMIENDEFWLSTKSHFSVASLNSYDQYIFELRMELKFINERNVFS